VTAPVFLADRAQLTADAVVLAGPEGRHAATVRRIRPGELVDLTDGAGLVARCVVHAAVAGRLELRVLSRRSEPPSQPSLVAVQAILKGGRADLAVEMMTEVGVDVIVPWAAQRSVPRWPGERGTRAATRWRDTAREAAKQARRAWLPEVTEPASTDDVIGRIAGAARAVVLDPGAVARLADVPLPRSGEVVMVAGPEGGLTDAEIEACAAAGAVPVRLGPAVLRASTVSAVAAAVLLTRCGRW
jgi:16S rRNA (uracil1498-N3)-methyltransferase